MLIVVKIVGLLRILAIAASAHPIVEKDGRPFVSYQNRTTSTVQEMVNDNKSAVEQISNSLISSIQSINDVQNDGEEPLNGGPEGLGVQQEVDESGKPPSSQPDDVKPDDAKPDDVKPDDVKPDDVKPDDVKPEVVKPEGVKPEGVKPGVVKPEIGKPILGEGGEETATTTKPEGENSEGATTEGGTPKTEASSSDVIRTSTAVLFPFMLVLVKYI